MTANVKTGLIGGRGMAQQTVALSTNLVTFPFHNYTKVEFTQGLECSHVSQHLVVNHLNLLIGTRCARTTA